MLNGHRVSQLNVDWWNIVALVYFCGENLGDQREWLCLMDDIKDAWQKSGRYG